MRTNMRTSIIKKICAKYAQNWDILRDFTGFWI